MTAGALGAIRELGLRIPDEIALVGFDDLDWTTLVDPPISVVAQPVAELGRTVAERLLERLAGRCRPAARDPPDNPPRRPGLLWRTRMSREAAELVTALVERDSTNPQLVPGGVGEGLSPTTSLAASSRPGSSSTSGRCCRGARTSSRRCAAAARARS